MYLQSADEAEILSTLIESVENRIRDDIGTGILTPQSKLRVSDLKERYEMGASPIREALSRLSSEGLVTFSSNRGFRVRGLSQQDLADIAYVRTAVETFAIRTAIARATLDWEGAILASLHALVVLTKETQTDRESLDTWNRAHDRFHEALIATCGSSRVLEIQRRMAGQHSRYRRMLMGANLPREKIINEHQDIAAAALERDADRAADLLGRHMLITSDFYARVLAGSEQAARADLFTSGRDS